MSEPVDYTQILDQKTKPIHTTYKFPGMLLWGLFLTLFFTFPLLMFRWGNVFDPDLYYFPPEMSLNERLPLFVTYLKMSFESLENFKDLYPGLLFLLFSMGSFLICCRTTTVHLYEDHCVIQRHWAFILPYRKIKIIYKDIKWLVLFVDKVIMGKSRRTYFAHNLKICDQTTKEKEITKVFLNEIIHPMDFEKDFPKPNQTQKVYKKMINLAYDLSEKSKQKIVFSTPETRSQNQS